MTVDTLLKKLENGEKVTTPKNDSLIIALQATINDTYSKLSIDVNISDNIVTFERIGDFEYKTNE